MVVKLAGALVATICIIVGVGALAAMVAFTFGYGSNIPNVDPGNFKAELFSLTVEATLFAVLFSYVLPKIIERSSTRAETKRWKDIRQEAVLDIFHHLSELSSSMRSWVRSMTATSVGELPPSKGLNLIVRYTELIQLCDKFSRTNDIVRDSLATYSAALTPELMRSIIQVKYEMNSHLYDLRSIVSFFDEIEAEYRNGLARSERSELPSLRSAIVQNPESGRLTNLLNFDSYVETKNPGAESEVEDIYRHLNLQNSIRENMSSLLDDAQFKKAQDELAIWLELPLSDGDYVSPFAHNKPNVFLKFDRHDPPWT